jgi:hypothetical protein
MIKLPNITLPERGIPAREFADYIDHKGFKLHIEKDVTMLIGSKVTEYYRFNESDDTFDFIKKDSDREETVKWYSLFYFDKAPLAVLAQALSTIVLCIAPLFNSIAWGNTLIVLLIGLVYMADLGWKRNTFTQVTKPLWIYKKIILTTSLSLLWVSILLKAYVAIKYGE